MTRSSYVVVDPDKPRPRFKRFVRDGTEIHETYILGKLLGQGSFGKVHYCEHAVTKQKYALKILPKSKFTHPTMRQLMMQELEILATLDHPHIVRVHDLMEDNKNFYVVSELVQGGELYDFLIKKKRLTTAYV